MKTLELNQLEVLSAGSGHGCLISGALAAATFALGFFNPMAWVGTAAITSSSANAGCFED